MCGRFTLTEVDIGLLTETFDLSHVSGVEDLAPRYNIAPTQSVATVIHDEQAGENRFSWMLWGLIPHWAKDRSWQSKLINARGESIHEKPSFRDAFKRKRCLILADGFYEWQAQPDGTKQPVYITVGNHDVFALAGLWSQWTEPDSGDVLTTCTIVTTTPNKLLAEVHNRMPVILPPSDYATWLDPALSDPDTLLPLVRAYPADRMSYYSVSRKVNRPTNDDPSLIVRAG